MTGRDEGRGSTGADGADRSPAARRDGGAGGGRPGVEEDVVAPLARRFLWADSPAAVERLIRGLYVACALLVAFELVWHRHAYVPGEELFGYHAIVGFFAFLLIVLGAKQLRRLIRRDESYYAPASVDAEPYPEAGLERRDARAGAARPSGDGGGRGDESGGAGRGAVGSGDGGEGRG